MLQRAPEPVTLHDPDSEASEIIRPPPHESDRWIEAKPDAEVDLRAGFAHPLPFAVICEQLGVDESCRRTLHDAFATLLRRWPSQALRRWLDRPGRNPGELFEMAAQFHGAESALRSALGVLP